MSIHAVVRFACDHQTDGRFDCAASINVQNDRTLGVDPREAPALRAHMAAVHGWTSIWSGLTDLRGEVLKDFCPEHIPG